MFEPTKILGNEKTISYLTEAAELGKLSHAYIIEGPKGSGKRTLADYLSEGLLCNGKGRRPCGKCPSCIKAMSGNHPDIIHVAHEKKTVLSIGEIRRQIIDTIQTPPFYGPYKIYIVEDSGLMNAHGQNALLKTIEEPPSYGLILLLTENSEYFLDTIRSRCIKLNTELLDTETVIQKLEGLGCDAQKAKKIASLTKGNLGEAICFLQDENAAAIVKDLVNCLENIEEKDAVQLLETAEIANPEERLLFLGLSEKWFRDVLFCKANLSENKLFFTGEASVLKKQSELLSYENINDILKEIQIAGERLRAQVKADQTIGLMLLAVRRILRGARKQFSDSLVRKQLLG